MARPQTTPFALGAAGSLLLMRCQHWRTGASGTPAFVTVGSLESATDCRVARPGRLVWSSGSANCVPGAGKSGWLPSTARFSS